MEHWEEMLTDLFNEEQTINKFLAISKLHTQEELEKLG